MRKWTLERINSLRNSPTNEELKRVRREGRSTTENAKQFVAIRIDPNVLSQKRKLAGKPDKTIPYQAYIHSPLVKATNKKTRRAM